MNNFFDLDYIIIVGGLIAITTIEKIKPKILNLHETTGKCYKRI